MYGSVNWRWCIITNFFSNIIIVREALEIVSIYHFVLFIYKKTLGLKAYKNLHADQLKCINYVSTWNFSEKDFPCAQAIPDYECKRIIMRHIMHQALTLPPLPGRVFVESLECSQARGKKPTLALIVITLGKQLQCGNSVTFLYMELSPLSSSFNKSLFFDNYHNKEIRRKDILRSKWYCIGL
mgnify:CR=1 FL=1